MSPHQTNQAWTEPMAISTKMRRIYRQLPSSPRDEARCICSENPMPNSNENIVMNFIFTDQAIANSATWSNLELARASFAGASRNS
ncbi:hypothetical protein [Lysobacter gummosus]|uniref:hypothetical protein n=1 Tax=Lysobacter gummosus TaxID=262324 RepID=UPI003644212C